jgi:general secretion pathway protein G
MQQTQGRRQAGFTLVELVTVMAVISVLVAIALPSYRYAVMHAREAVLKEDLFNFRRAIDEYKMDKGHYPESLQTLVEEGYLRRLEPDPITQAMDWEEVEADPDPARPDEPSGIYDVKSSSERDSLSGEPYSEW